MILGAVSPSRAKGNKMGFFTNDDSKYFATKKNDNGTLSLTGFSAEFSKKFSAQIRKITFPAVVSGKKVTAIADNFDAEGLAKGKVFDTIEIQEGIKKIGEYAFAEITINKSLKLPDTLETIGKMGLKGEIKSLNIPASVKSIGSWRKDTSSLEKITVDAANKNYCSVNGVLFTKDKKTLIRYPNCKSGKKFVVPDNTELMFYAFARNKNLTDVTLPKTPIKEISSGVFRETLIESIIIPDNVTIDVNAFLQCSKLISVKIGKNAIIENESFKGCAALENVEIGPGANVGKTAFSGCKKLSQEFFKKIENPIDKYFTTKENADKTLTITGFGKEFPKDFFENHDTLAFPSIIYAKKVTAIADNFDSEGVSKGKSIDTVVIPEGVKTLGDFVFENFSINKSLKLPSTLETMGKMALKGEIKTVNIPASVNKIAMWSHDTSCLEKITVDANSQKFCSVDGVLFTKNKNMLYRYPNCKKGENFLVPKSTDLQGYAFAHNKNLKNIDLSLFLGEFGEIWYGAFLDSAITEIKINCVNWKMMKNITIKKDAFRNCHKLKYVSIGWPEEANYYDPNKITIEENVFAGCEALETVVLDCSRVTVAENAFDGFIKFQD